MVYVRKPLPPYALRTPGGQKVYLPELKGKILVLLRQPDLARALATRQEELSALEAQAYLLSQEVRESPLPLLLDPEGKLIQVIPEQGALIADAFLEVYHLGPVRDAGEILEWVRFVGSQCPECVLPEAEWL
ncbi:peroxiredoxin family protein [Thermus albus]|uniref:peroxiredoxin family protein n=1 Tax=Thermus albus TaxID=2908146 RepID=UPI001FA9CD92|nr:peroxiredoxin family protein [Thermus albus]